MSFIKWANSWIRGLWHGELPGLNPDKRHHYRAGIVVTIATLVLATVAIASIHSEDSTALNQARGMIARPPVQLLSIRHGDNALVSAQQDAAAQTLDATNITPVPFAEQNHWQWIKVTVRRGDTLSAILQRQNIDHPKLRQAIQASTKAKALYRLAPGQIINLGIDNDGALQRLTYPINSFETLTVQRSKDVFSVTTEKRKFETRIAFVTGIINRSLFDAGQQAGLSDPMIMRLVELFGWDIDFVLDIRRGDNFAVIYEEKYWRGQKIADGQIIAAEFVNRGKSHRVIAHNSGNGFTAYFTPEGRSIKRTFLRAPVKLSRITSRFTLRRYHPILKRWRAHRGVDYGSPSGTPIRSTASGRVIHVGRKGGYGRTVIIKHGGVYSTLYAHMRRFNRGIRLGGYVDQGQIIGYVGSTGLATGPHLHYEFRVNKRHRNPLTYKFPQAAPIQAKYRQEFLQQSQQWVLKLNTISRNGIRLARKHQ